MANRYVRSTDGNNADDGSTWALAKANLSAVASIDTAGDNIYLSQAHSESVAATTSLIFAGTIAAPTKIIGANDSAEPPTALAGTKPVFSNNSATNINGILYCANITWRLTGSTAITLNSSPTAAYQVYEDCIFETLADSSVCRLVVGSSSDTTGFQVTFRNCNLKFGNSGQSLRTYASIQWIGGAIAAGSVSPLAFLTFGAGARGNVLIDGVDLSVASSTMKLVNIDATVKVIFRNCKLPASWSGTLTTATPLQGGRAEMHNCDSADTNYRMWIEDFAGSIRSETTIVRSGGASDGTISLSWKMTSNANCVYPLASLPSPEIARWNETVGSAITVSVDIVRDSATALTNADIWLEVEYMGTSGYPLGSFASERCPILTTPSDHSSSSATWTTTGLTSPNKQTLSVTFTPAEVGYLLARVVVGKTSATVYVDPKLQVS